jgi:hypothetical protein
MRIVSLIRNLSDTISTVVSNITHARTHADVKHPLVGLGGRTHLHCFGLDTSVGMIATCVTRTRTTHKRTPGGIGDVTIMAAAHKRVGLSVWCHNVTSHPSLRHLRATVLSLSRDRAASTSLWVVSFSRPRPASHALTACWGGVLAGAGGGVLQSDGLADAAAGAGDDDHRHEPSIPVGIFCINL